MGGRALARCELEVLRQVSHGLTNAQIACKARLYGTSVWADGVWVDECCIPKGQRNGGQGVDGVRGCRVL